MIAGLLLTKQTCLLTYDFFPLVHSRELLGLAVYTGKSLLLFCYSVIYLLNNYLSSLAVNSNNYYACSNCDSLLVRSSYLVSDHLTQDVRNNYLLASCTLNSYYTLASDYGYVLSCDGLVSCCVAFTKLNDQSLLISTEAQLTVVAIEILRSILLRVDYILISNILVSQADAELEVLQSIDLTSLRLLSNY